jgi:sugar phosphate isomerase/epimerase
MTTQFSRRDVLRYAAAAAVAVALPAGSLAQGANKVPIGVQLYSVRKELPKDFVGTIQALGKMGYQGVEFAGYFGWDQKPQELRKLLDDNGLKCCGTHVQGGVASFSTDRIKKEIELHKILGNKFLICPSMLGRGPTAWLNLAKQFTDIAARLKEDGMYTGYHSHAPDFNTKYDGKTVWEIFFDNTSPDVVHQLDIGNTLDGGGDPVAMIKKYPGRTKTTHLKDHGGGKDDPIGAGTNDWKALFEAYDNFGGTEWFIVEHETSSDPLKTLKGCIDNLHKMGR